MQPSEDGYKRNILRNEPETALIFIDRYVLLQARIEDAEKANFRFLDGFHKVEPRHDCINDYALNQPI